MNPLNELEQQILQLAADGCSYADMVEPLGRSEGCIKQLAHHAMVKLGADNRTHAVALALRRGLIR